MKKLIALILLIVAIGAQSQVLVKIKSKSALADSIWINRGAIEVQPYVTGNNTDTIRSLDYRIRPYRDTLQSMTIEINAYNKSAALLNTEYFTIPQSIFTRWKVLINALDAYIAQQRKRVTKL